MKDLFPGEIKVPQRGTVFPFLAEKPMMCFFILITLSCWGQLGAS